MEIWGYGAGGGLKPSLLFVIALRTQQLKVDEIIAAPTCKRDDVIDMYFGEKLEGHVLAAGCTASPIPGVDRANGPHRDPSALTPL